MPAAATYVPGPELQTPVDNGSVDVATRRVVFTGGTHTREWSFAKLLNVDTSGAGATLLRVSNRQKVSGLNLGRSASTFNAYLTLGVLISQQGADAVSAAWAEEAETHRTARPDQR